MFQNLSAGQYEVSISAFSLLSTATNNTTIQVIGASPGPVVPLSQLKPSPDFRTISGPNEVGWDRLLGSAGLVNVANDGGGFSVILSTTDANGVLYADAVRADRISTTSYEYDRNGNLTKQTDTRGNVTDYDYDEMNRQTIVTLPDPDTASGNNDGPNGSDLGRPSTVSNYDGYGNLILSTNTRGTAGSTADDVLTKYEYDRRNQLIKKVVDYSTNPADPAHENITTTYQYDKVGNQTLITNPVGAKTFSRYDNDDRLIDQIEGYGQATSVIRSVVLDGAVTTQGTGTVERPADNASITLTGDVAAWAQIATYHVTPTTVLEFDLQALQSGLVQVIGFDTDSQFTTGEKNRYFELGGRKWLTAWHTTDFHQNGAPASSGTIQIPIGEYLTETEKINGLDISRLVFRNFDDPAAVDAQDKGKYVFSNIRLYESDEVRTVYTYDARGNVETVQEKSDPRDIKTLYKYDKLGRRTHKVLDSGVGGMTRSYETVYDFVGNVKEEKTPTGNGSASVSTTHEYDFLNRRVKTTLPDADGIPSTLNGLDTTFAYDAAGQLISETNGEGETTRTAYDSVGNVVSQTDGNGDETRYQYDSEGNLRAVTDAQQNTTTYTYDGLGRQIVEHNDFGNRTRIYDNAGNLFQIVDRNNRIRQFTYDNLDRRKEELWLTTTNLQASHVLSWQYDDLGRVTKQVDGDGNYPATTDDLVDTYQYDALGRLVEERNYDPAALSQGSGSGVPRVKQSFAYAFTYSGGVFQDRVTRTQSSVGGTSTAMASTTYDYDRLGQLAATNDGDAADGPPTVGSKQLAFVYDAAGNLDQIVRRYNGQLVAGTNYGQDKANRTTSITHDLSTDIVHNYGYDNASRVTSFNTGATTRGYAYDDAGQLKTTTGTAGESYAYDDNGNRTQKNSQAVQSDPFNRLKNDGTYAYTYDPEGNVKTRTVLVNGLPTGAVTTYAYDHRNRLTSVTEAPAATLPASAQIGEVGQITNYNQPIESYWQPVTLQRTYTNPVVIMQLASANDAAPAMIRVRGAGGNQFEFQVSEWDVGLPPLQDGVHNAETINYLVVEEGDYTLPGGGRVVARRDTAAQLQGNPNNFQKHVTFTPAFSGTPVVLTQLMTISDATDAAISRLATVDGAGFNLKLQEQKSNDNLHASEMFGYVAIQAGSGTMPGIGPFQALTTQQLITHAWSQLSGFATTPLAFAATQTNAESPGTPPAAWARLRPATSGNLEIHVEEENSDGFNTTAHVAEKVAALGFASGGLLYKDFTATAPAAPTTSYVYDADGRRVKRTFDADGSGAAQQPTSEYFVYDGGDLALRYSGATGSASALSHRYLNGPQTDQVLVDEVFSTTGGNIGQSIDTLWMLADQQGTIRDVIDNTGTLRKHVEYDSVGKVTSDQTVSGAAVEQLFYYTGQERDAGTGLQLHGARWYSPAMGRFVNEDPSGFAGDDANLYRYAGNDRSAKPFESLDA